MSKKPSNVSKTRRRLLKLSKPDLVKECKIHNLSIYGNKSKLVKRLTIHINDNCHCTTRESSTPSKTSPKAPYTFKSNYNRCNKSEHIHMPTLSLSLTPSAMFEEPKISKSHSCKINHIKSRKKSNIKDKTKKNSNSKLKLNKSSTHLMKNRKCKDNDYCHNRAKTFAHILEPVDFEAYFTELFNTNSNQSDVSK